MGEESKKRIGGNLDEIQENFVKVLYEYSQYENISCEGDIVLKLIDEDLIEEYSDVFDLEESVEEEVVLDLEEEFEEPEISDVKVVEESIGKGLSLKIDEVEFRYVSDKYSVSELRHKIIKNAEGSVKKALEWLKENAVNYWNEWQIKPKEEVNEEKEDQESHEDEEDKEENKTELQEKIEDWRDKIKKFDKEDIIEITSVADSGIIVSVFEDEEGEEHLNNPVIKEINNYLQDINENMNIEERWKFDSDGVSTWYTSVNLEEDYDDGEEEEIVEEVKEFRNNIVSGLKEVTEDYDIEFRGFRGKEGIGLDLLFVGEEIEEDKQEAIKEGNMSEYMDTDEFVTSVSEKMKEIVEDYEDSDVKVDNLDISLEEEKVKMKVNYKLIEDSDSGK